MTGEARRAEQARTDVGAEFEGVTGNAVSVAAWTVVSRVAGLAKLAAIAAVLGPTYLGNTYQATNLIPNTVYELLTGSLFASLLVPPLVANMDNGGKARAARTAGGVLTLVIGGLSLLGLVVVISGPLLLRVLTLGVDSPQAVTDELRVGWILIALFMPQVVLYGIAGVGAAAQNSCGRFALAAAAPALESIGMIITLTAAAVIYGTDVSLATITMPELILLGVGTTASVGLHAGMQWFGARRCGLSLIPRAGWRDPEAMLIARRAVPSLGYAGLNALRTFGALVVSSSVAGGVVAFQLALSFYYLPVAIGARPVSTALLPRLARLFNHRALQDFGTELGRGLQLIFFLTFPIAVFYAALSGPIADAVLIGHHAQEGAALVAVSLAALAPGVIGESSFVLSTQACYATYDPVTPFRAMILRTTVSVAGMGIALVLGGPLAVLAALGLAMSAGNLLSAWRLHRQISGRLGETTPGLAAAIVRDIAASVAMAAAAWVVAIALASAIPGEVGQLIAVLGAVPVGGVVFIISQRALHYPELVLLRGTLRQIRLGSST